MPFSHEPVYWDQETGELFWERNALNDARRVVVSGGGGSGYVLPIATAGRLGGVRSSASLLVDAATGVATVSLATTAASGIVQLADTAAINAGTPGLVVDASQLKAAVAAGGVSYTLPVATESVLGGIRQGPGFNVIGSGTLEVDARSLTILP